MTCLFPATSLDPSPKKSLDTSLGILNIDDMNMTTYSDDNFDNNDNEDCLGN